jgi:hypothetical protein
MATKRDARGKFLRNLARSGANTREDPDSLDQYRDALGSLERAAGCLAGKSHFTSYSRPHRNKRRTFASSIFGKNTGTSGG